MAACLADSHAFVPQGYFMSDKGSVKHARSLKKDYKNYSNVLFHDRRKPYKSSNLSKNEFTPRSRLPP